MRYWSANDHECLTERTGCRQHPLDGSSNIVYTDYCIDDSDYFWLMLPVELRKYVSVIEAYVARTRTGKS